MINEVIKKLRKAADALDELMDVMPSANMKAARSIRVKVDRNLGAATEKFSDKELLDVFADGYNQRFLEMGKGKTPTLKEFKKKWTSKKQVIRKKKHWTQTKAGKKKMSLAQKAMWARKKGQK